MSISEHNTRRQIFVYALLLGSLAVGCCFHRLSEGTLFGDEAAFACTTERMLASGDWVVPFLAESPHLNATPLYNWLTMGISAWFDDAPFRHRFWSAAFGVGCVMVTFAMGTLLFRAQVGLLAGLFLVFNKSFLFDHGVRFGGMDAMLTFFITSAVLAYAWLLTQPTRRWSAWSLLGACIGLAALAKPPAFAGFFFAVIGLHHAWARRGAPWADRFAGPMLAGAVGFAIASPWYILMWSRLGTPFLHALFIYNSVERALDPSQRDLLCCHRFIAHASNSFKLVEPALLCASACCLIANRRSQWSILLILAGSFLLALSAAGKCGQYPFYAFPLLAVLLAGFFLESGPHLMGRFMPRLAGCASVAGVALAVILVVSDSARVLSALRGPFWIHPVVGIHNRLVPELESRRCRLVLFDFPGPDGITSSGRGSGNFEELYYLPRIKLADRVRDLDDLRNLLADGMPAIVLLPPLTVPQPVLTGLRPDSRIAENPWPTYAFPTLAFNGGDSLMTRAELAKLCRGSQR